MKELVAVMAIVTSMTEVTAWDWVETVDYAGRQRMLTQKMSKEFLLVAAGYNEQFYKDEMKKSIKLFDDTLNTLGNDEIKATEKVRNDIKAISAQWIPFKSLLENNVDSVQHTDLELLLDVTTRNVPLLKVSDALVSTYNGESGMKSDVTINLAGKQRMRIQRMMKAIVALSLGVDMEHHSDDLKATSLGFSESHTGLIRGVQIADVPELTNACTMKQMRLVSSHWEKVEPIIMQILDEKTFTLSQNTAEEKLPVAIGEGEQLFTEMVSAVEMFVSPKTDCELLYNLTEEEIVFLLNTGGKQRMLSQKATFLYALIALAVDQAQSTTDLLLTAEEGESTLRQLIEGDSANEIPSPPSQAFLDGLQNAWTSFTDLRRVFDQAIYQQKTSETLVANADTHSSFVLAKMSAACELMVQDAVLWAEMKGVDLPVRVVDMAGRQRMLMQKLSKEAALIRYGTRVDAMKDRFEATIALFSDSHRKLLNGARGTNTSAELPPTTDYCIIQQMKHVMDLFTQIEETAREVAYGDATDSVENLRRLASLGQGGFDAMNRAVGFYVAGQGTCDSQANSAVGISVPEEWKGYASLLPEEWESYVRKLGRLRELMHIVSKNDWLVRSGVNRTHYQNARDASILEVYDTIQILKLGAGRVPAPRTQTDFDLFDALEGEWSTFEGALTASKTADAMNASDGQMLAEVERSIARAVTAAGEVETKVPVFRLNVATRQLALVEKMTKEVLIHVLGGLRERRLSIEGEMPWVSTMHLYEQSHQELLQMTHDQRDDVLDQMKRTEDAWVVFKEAFLVVADGSTNPKDIRAMDARLTALRAELESSVQAYLKVVQYVPTPEPPFRSWVRLIQIMVPVCLILFPAMIGAGQGVRDQKSRMEP